MLRKTAIVTVIPAVAGQAFVAPSTVCTPPPPPNNGGIAPPSGDGAVLYYVYVPNNPANPDAGEVRMPSVEDPGAGYVCDVDPQLYLVQVGDVTQPVMERRCYWSYA